jgi:hypothetical protein
MPGLLLLLGLLPLLAIHPHGELALEERVHGKVAHDSSLLLW